MLFGFNDRGRVFGHFTLSRVHPHIGEVVLVDDPNIILDVGLDGLAAAMVEAAAGGSGRSLYAIQLGDNGTVLSDPFMPAAVPPTRTSLFHELGARTNLHTGFTATPSGPTITCSRLFRSTDYATGDFLDASKLYVNEAMMYLGKAADDPDADWVPFAMKAFKSIPFGPGDGIDLLARWAFTFERGET